MSVTTPDLFSVADGKDAIQSLTPSLMISVEGNQTERQIDVHKAVVAISVGLQGLEDGLGNSAGVKLMIPQCG